MPDKLSIMAILAPTATDTMTIPAPSLNNYFTPHPLCL
jgi:hypothetical protein